MLKFCIRCSATSRIAEERKSKLDSDLFTELEWLVEGFCLRNPLGKMPFLSALRPSCRRDAMERVFDELRGELDSFLWEEIALT